MPLNLLESLLLTALANHHVIRGNQYVDTHRWVVKILWV